MEQKELTRRKLKRACIAQLSNIKERTAILEGFNVAAKEQILSGGQDVIIVP